MKTKTRSAKPAEPQYPMHEKLKELGDRRAIIQEFIDWLFDEQKWWLCEYIDDWNDEDGETGFVPIRKRREDIMAEFFDIDLVTLEDEKRAMLDVIRKHNEQQDAGAVDGTRQ